MTDTLLSFSPKVLVYSGNPLPCPPWSRWDWESPVLCLPRGGPMDGSSWRGRLAVTLDWDPWFYSSWSPASSCDLGSFPESCSCFCLGQQ